VKILAVDTATEACSAALLTDGEIVAREMEFERGHAEHILPMVEAVLSEGGTSLAALDAIAFGRGPGGFTGVRLAASVVQGLAFAADRPVVPVSDLAAVAQRALDLDRDVSGVVVCNDARMQQVYWGCFERGATRLASAVGVERVGAPETVGLWPHWRTSSSATSKEQRVEVSGTRRGEESAEGSLSSARAALIGAAGRGFSAYKGALSKLLADESVRLISDTLLPRAHEIARLAAPEVKAGRAQAPENAIPVYLRDDVARPRPSRN
jgi:tRNA threonylcarbamoyladenosine biosynthesis protein TsaB